MEKERSTKTIAIIALVVAVASLSIGFAAYTRNLEITDIEGTVTPGDMDLDVFFDNDQTKGNDLVVVKGIGTAAVEDETGATINNTSLDSGANPTISDFRANFSKKGESVTYTFYVYNNSPYNAYLESVTFTGAEPHKTCVALDPKDENDEVVANACKDITLSLQVGTDTILSTGESTFKSHTIGAGNWQEVTVTIAYDGTEYPLPAGDMKVTFAGIRLGYTTIAQ